MKHLTGLLLVAAAVVLLACGGRKHDMVRYQQMIDSIQKAEQVKEIQRTAGIYTNLADAFFDTLSYHSLPVQSETGYSDVESSLVDVPLPLNEQFGFPPSAKLRALRLPTAWRRQIMMVSEYSDSTGTTRYLFVFDDHHQPLDVLLIGQKRRQKRNDVEGVVSMEYFVTSHYEITLMQYFLADGASRPQQEQVRRYIINREGKFEEVIIEL